MHQNITFNSLEYSNLSVRSLPQRNNGEATRGRYGEVKMTSERLTSQIQIDLWDCSGDRKYEAGWSTMTENIDGVAIIFNPENKKAERELENW